MSLFDQAIRRLQNQASNKNTPVAAVPNPAQPTEAAVEPSKRMMLDLDVLRSLGYLPEASIARQFSNHYRRIKRPLIEKAMSPAESTNSRRVIMVTSALPGDGKTFTSINLALSMAQERDISVLMVDCDVAKRHVSDLVGMRQDIGLLDALVDDSLDVESLSAVTDIRGLSILPAGTASDGAAELLSSNRMRQVIAALCSRSPRRIVLLDSPPLLVTEEARALTRLAGQVVLVVRAGHTPRQAVIDALGLFDDKQTGGIILNHVSAGRADQYYGNYGYGSYGADAT